MDRSVPLALVLSSALGATLVHSPLELLTTRVVLLVCLLASFFLGLLVLVALLRRLPRLVRIGLRVVLVPLALRAVYFALVYHWLTPELAVAGLGLGVAAFWSVPLPRLRPKSPRLVQGAGLFGLALGALWSALPTGLLVTGLIHHRTPLGLLSHGGLLIGPFALGLLSSSSGSAETAVS
jgi:hypothetical protein